MALLDEQLVEEWLNRQQFFTMRGLRSGVNEIDLLAVRLGAANAEYWHVEVQISFRPIGYIGGDTNARRRDAEEIRAGVEQWVEKKFTSAQKVDRRNAVVPNVRWRYVLVHAELRDATELDHMRELGVDAVPYKNVLADLCKDHKGTSSSTASSITDILRYIK